jgi:hypothetical protein
MVGWLSVKCSDRHRKQKAIDYKTSHSIHTFTMILIILSGNKIPSVAISQIKMGLTDTKSDENK